MIFTIALIGSMVGSILIASKHANHRIYASIIWFIANCIWLSGSISEGDINQSMLWVFYNIMCIITFNNNYKLLKK